MADKLTLAVNEAVSQARNLAALSQRMSGLGSNDAKRPNAWCEYGYPENPTFDTFYSLYRRHGVAHGAVTKLNEKCFETPPRLIEGDEYDDKRPLTPWEKRVNEVFKASKFWKQFRLADRQRLVGRFAGLLLQVRDGAQWDQPINVTPRLQIVKLVPVWEGQLKVKAWNIDPLDENYGEPSAWTYNEAAVGEDTAARQLEVHPDRIILLGDFRNGSSLLEPGLNSFINLEKIEGGSGESFLKNASRQLNVNFDKEVDFANIARTYGVPVDQLQEKFNEAAREINSGVDLLMLTQGATVTPLVAAVPDPSPHYVINLQTASASVGIPSRILVGNQQAERSSTEDRAEFNARCQGRRLNVLNEDIELAAKHLMRIGAIETINEFTVIWDDLTESSTGEKLANAKVMSEINAANLASGELVFSPEEIRDLAGFDNTDPVEPLPDEDEE